jgi:hypothetical protein
MQVSVELTLIRRNMDGVLMFAEILVAKESESLNPYYNRRHGFIVY